MIRIAVRSTFCLFSAFLASCNQAQEIEFEKIKNRIEALEIIVAEQKTVLAERNSLRPELERLQKELRQERAKNEELQRRCLLLEADLEALRKKSPELAPSSPAPIDTVVKVVKLDDMLVILGAGREEGVREGYEFQILRENKLIGNVKVIKVYPDLSGAKILSTTEGEVVRIGDRATTKF